MRIVHAPSSVEVRGSSEPLSPEQLVQRIIELGQEKKAHNIVALDIRRLSTLADYFVIMSGASDYQVRAIAGSLRETLRKERVRTVGSEGTVAGHWIVLDYGDVIVHIFHDETRAFYDLEGLWGDAPHVFAE